MQALLSKKTEFFLCNSYPNTFQRVVEKNIPKALLDSTVCIESLGGIPPFTSPKNAEWMLTERAEHLVRAIGSR